MKFKALAALCALASSAFGGSVSFTNIGGLPVFDNVGNPIDVGFAAVVTFATAPTNETELRAAMSNAVVSGNQVVGVPSSQGAFNVGGNYTLGVEANLGDVLYLVLARDTDLSNPLNPIGLIGSGLTVDSDTPLPDSNTFIFNAGAGNVIVGNLGDGRSAPDQSGLGQNPGVSGLLLSAVPEPSTSLLAALAGLGLVARRRRA